MTKILSFDIETTDLDGDFGNMLAFGYKWVGQPNSTKVISLLDVNPICKGCGIVSAVDDSKLVKAACEILKDADIWLTWYGKGFDQKFVNTRILDAKLPPLPGTPHVDLYWAAKMHLKLSSNRLASVQDFLQLPTAKTPLTKRVWRRAQAGDVPSIKYIIEHCEKDVEVLEQAYDILKPYVRLHPHVGKRGDCRVCGGKFKSQGVRMAYGKKIRRLRCLKCGYWDRENA